MFSRKVLGAVATILMAAALTSCNVGKAPAPTTDVNAIYTFAAQTMSAGLASQQTQTAMAVTPTSAASPTPLVSATPLATFTIATSSVPFGLPTFAVNVTPLPASTSAGTGAVGCNNATYQGETGPADKTDVAAGKPFEKAYSMENTGTCTWNAGYSFAFLTGQALGGKDVTITNKGDFTDPGHTQSFVLKLTAPTTPGEYIGYWQMKAPDGTRFGDRPWFDVIVK